jgi:hypothetical protein
MVLTETRISCWPRLKRSWKQLTLLPAAMVSSKPNWALSVLSGTLLTLAGCSSSGGLPSERLADAALPIVGGQLDSLHTNVFGLVLRKADGIATCSSTLLAPNLLLTARHCVSEHVEDPVVCGSAGLGLADGPENFSASNARRESSEQARARRERGFEAFLRSV